LSSIGDCGEYLDGFESRFLSLGKHLLAVFDKISISSRLPPVLVPR
jgi:hypothetical protein